VRRGRGDNRWRFGDVRLASKQRKREGSGRGDQRRERRSIFFFFWYTRRRRVRGAGPDGPDEELEEAEIGFNYFTKDLLKKGLINFSGLRGAKAQAGPGPESAPAYHEVFLGDPTPAITNSFFSIYFMVYFY
jgi:hypothetical protein